MKTAAFLLAVLLVLSGCARQRPVPTLPVQPPTEAAALPTEPAARVTEPVQTQPPETETTEAQTEPTVPPEDDALVHIRTWIPGIGQELRYAGENNIEQIKALVIVGSVKHMIPVNGVKKRRIKSYGIRADEVQYEREN